MVKGRRGPPGPSNGKPLPKGLAEWWHKTRRHCSTQNLLDLIDALKKAEDERRRRLLPNDQALEDLDNSAASVLTGENS